MAKANQNHTTPIAPLDARWLPVPDGWMWIGEAFLLMTHIVGDPGEALYEIRREVLAGRVRSMRQRPLKDGAEAAVLPRTFWRDVELFPTKDDQGREVIGLRLAEGADRSAVSGCIFYLFRADVHKVWPLVSEPSGPTEEKPAGDQIMCRRQKAGRPSAKGLITDEIERRQKSDGERLPERIGEAAYILWQWLNERRKTDKTIPEMKNAKSVANLMRRNQLWPPQKH